MSNLVLTESSGTKCHAVMFTVPISLVSVCVTQIIRERVGVEKGAYAEFGIHHAWLLADLPTDLWAIETTGRETTDFKKAVSVKG